MVSSSPINLCCSAALPRRNWTHCLRRPWCERYPETLEMRRTDAAFGLALLLSSLALTGCTLGHADSGAPQAGGRGAGDGQAVPITVGRVVQKPVPLQLQVIGTVEPSSTVAIRAQVT